jgi:peptide-methionine (R)-S-oxide reductase
MRFPSIPRFIQTIYAFSIHTIPRRSAPLRPSSLLTRHPIALRSSMPIPFLGALFSTADSRKMSYPVQKSDQEWQAVLSKGKYLPRPPKERTPI